MLEKRTVGDRLDDHDTEEVLVRYIYSNHLQSASLELDESAAIISYEEYHPYGTTSFQSNDATVHANAKRYRYTGKERDEESGLYYHGARYYIPWLCRWSAVDPINSEWYNMLKGTPKRNLERDFLELCASPYEYAYDNPLMFNDPSGEQPPQQKDVIAKVSGVSSLSNAQMVDALKLARNEVSERLDKKMKFEVGAQGSIKALGTDIAAYAKAHHLTAQQTLDFHRSANQYYIGLATVATNSLREYQQLNRTVINNDHLSNYQKLDISIHKMINSYVNLWKFMKITADVAMIPAIEAIGVSNVGPGPGKPRINSDKRVQIVAMGTPKTRGERLNMFKERLLTAPNANNPDEAIKLINKTLDQVEDAYSGVVKNTKAASMPNRNDGRMYGILDDTYVTRNPNGSVRAMTKGHRIEIQSDGSFSIFERKTGNLFLQKVNINNR